MLVMLLGKLAGEPPGPLCPCKSSKDPGEQQEKDRYVITPIKLLLFHHYVIHGPFP